MPDQVVALSGGKDSTVLALRLAEQGETFSLLFNATGDELDELLAHVARVAALTGRKLHVTNPGFSLTSRIEHYVSTPNHRMRWCTRELKIQPTQAFLLSRPGATLCVGLRADETHRPGAVYGDGITYRLPLQEWGWGLAEVQAYLRERGMTVPDRTDCALCYDQRLGEWYRLWKEHPERFAEGERLEELTGHTFRSPTAGKYPHKLSEMRQRFEAGQLPRGVKELPLFGEIDTTPRSRCRACSL